MENAILAATPQPTTSARRCWESELAGITSLDLSSQSISALASGDLAGLTGLTALDLSDNDLSSLRWTCSTA